MSYSRFVAQCKETNRETRRADAAIARAEKAESDSAEFMQVASDLVHEKEKAERELEKAKARLERIGL
jgi:hypothetical protein